MVTVVVDPIVAGLLGRGASHQADVLKVVFLGFLLRYVRLWISAWSEKLT